MKIKAIILAITLVGCGSHDHHDRRTPRSPSSDSERIKELERKILALQGTTTQINELIYSDYKTCPASGDTADILIRKICQVAQAATVEMQVELTAKLASFVDELDTQITAINDNLVSLQTQDELFTSSIASIDTAIVTINDTLSDLDTRLSDAESAIDALETLTSSITTTVAGTMEAVEIGVENMISGPFYETLLRRTDKTRINAYVEAYDPWVALVNNPLRATNGSPDIEVTYNAHGYSVGDVIELVGLNGGRGFSNGHVTGRFTIIEIVDSNKFKIVGPKLATSTGTFGSNSGFVRKALGAGMGTIWETADGADVAVRETGLGKPYNFIIKSTGFVCYDKTNAVATFATIDAGGVNIICK